MRVILSLIYCKMNASSMLKILFISGFMISVIHLAAKQAPDQVIEIRFERHRFTPQSVLVPAGRQVRIRIVNLSAERIEFESFKLNRERVVDPGEAVTMNLPPLKAGSYDFYDDFHADVPEGEIVAR